MGCSAKENNNLHINLCIDLVVHQSPTLSAYVPLRCLVELFFMQQFQQLVPNPYSIHSVMCEYYSRAKTGC